MIQINSEHSQSKHRATQTAQNNCTPTAPGSTLEYLMRQKIKPCLKSNVCDVLEQNTSFASILKTRGEKKNPPSRGGELPNVN